MPTFWHTCPPPEIFARWVRLKNVWLFHCAAERVILLLSGPRADGFQCSRAISTWSKLFAIIEKTSEVSKTSEVCVCVYKEKLPGYFGLYFTPCRT